MIKNYSKKNKEEKINLLPNVSAEEKSLLVSLYQDKLEKLTENVISSYSLPLSIAPNCLINNEYFQVPMVTEESSIVAACSNAFKFIASHGGFQAKINSDIKMGNIYLEYNPELLNQLNQMSPLKEPEIMSLNENMKTRNAGILDTLVLKVNQYIKISIYFSTAQSMGANFINTILEKYSEIILRKHPQAKIIMSILSNNYESSTVEASFKIKKSELTHTNLNPEEFYHKFSQAMHIATIDPDRAMTHNKGFMNGVDAILLATGQDYRAMNAAIHAYAAKNGSYQSLTKLVSDPNYLILKVILPYSLGVVGGITTVHPLVKTNLKIIKANCEVNTLAQIIACTGLAQNFAAVSALISSGIQKGHMKMHLSNILTQLGATESEEMHLKKILGDQHISYNKVAEMLKDLRK